MFLKSIFENYKNNILKKTILVVSKKFYLDILATTLTQVAHSVWTRPSDLSLIHSLNFKINTSNTT